MGDGAVRERAPKRVIVVVVLAYISGILDIIAGILLILLRYDDEVERAGDAYAITLLGAAMILIGLLTIAMASGLTRGRNSARIYVTALVSISALVSIVDFVRDPSTVWSLVIGGVIAVLIVLALWAGRSAEFFRRSRTR
jgi:O-antigen/teichoic acid export membrane protein